MICVLFVHWSAEVSSEGGVAPQINLLTKIPEKALQLFPSKAVGGAAEAFHSLLRILGPEAAIESVIRAVTLRQQAEAADQSEPSSSVRTEVWTKQRFLTITQQKH
ncbi:hypothetical protein INR49_014185 [Caranx melampygus]|nr:hypothetical protein INR49_014185 [Caranx melampygus]